MIIGQYILDENKQPIPVDTDDTLVWAEWFEKADRVVGLTYVGKTRISTVFLGLDHGFGLSTKPLLFETMIFGGKHNDYQDRYATWAEAEAGHKAAVKLVKDWRRRKFLAFGLVVLAVIYLIF